MNDAKIRKVVHSQIIRHYHRSPRALVVDELGLHHGQSRIDIAVINGGLYGYEIKSECDDLSRLPIQVESYNQVFEKLTLIVAERLFSQSLKIIPEWWGVIVVGSGARGGAKLCKYRNVAENPGTDPHAIAKLLWKNEAVEVLQSIGLSRNILRERRSSLYRMLVDSFNVNELQSEVCIKLKSRQNWRGPSRPL